MTSSNQISKLPPTVRLIATYRPSRESAPQPLRESFAFDEFQNEESPVSAFSQIVNGRHMRMIEPRDNFRFTLETTEPLGVARKLFGKDLDGNVALFRFACFGPACRLLPCYSLAMTPEERFTKIENVIQSLTEIQTRHDVQIEKQNLGIRDLITVSRTLLDSQKGLTSQVQELSETQKHTDEKLNLLIDTVQRFIQGQSPNENS